MLVHVRTQRERNVVLDAEQRQRGHYTGTDAVAQVDPVQVFRRGGGRVADGRLFGGQLDDRHDRVSL